MDLFKLHAQGYLMIMIVQPSGPGCRERIAPLAENIVGQSARAKVFTLSQPEPPCVVLSLRGEC